MPRGKLEGCEAVDDEVDVGEEVESGEDVPDVVVEEEGLGRVSFG